MGSDESVMGLLKEMRPTRDICIHYKIYFSES